MLFGFSLYDLAAYFLIYSCLGWCVEVVFHAVSCGKLINRGFLNGPVCPIYGFGMLAVLLLLTPLQDDLLLLYVGGTLLPSAIELLGGWALFQLYHTRWWDYSDRPFNLGGYICLEFSLLWGIGTVLIVRVVHPSIAALAGLMPHTAGIVVMAILYLVYAADLVATAITAAGLSRDLDALEDIADGIHAVSDAMTQVIGGTALASDQRLDEGRLQLKLAAAEARDAAEKLSPRDAADKAHALAQTAIQTARQASDSARASAAEAASTARQAAIGTAERTKDSIAQQLDLEALRGELEARAAVMHDRIAKSSSLFGAKRLLRAFPQMKHGQRSLSLDSLRDKLDEKRGK